MVHDHALHKVNVGFCELRSGRSGGRWQSLAGFAGSTGLHNRSGFWRHVLRLYNKWNEAKTRDENSKCFRETHDGNTPHTRLRQFVVRKTTQAAEHKVHHAITTPSI